MTNPKRDKLQQLVADIVDDLFTNGQGERADRLVLVIDNGRPPRDIGGWGRGAMHDRILKHLTRRPLRAGARPA